MSQKVFQSQTTYVKISKKNHLGFVGSIIDCANCTSNFFKRVEVAFKSEIGEGGRIDFKLLPSIQLLNHYFFYRIHYCKYWNSREASDSSWSVLSSRSTKRSYWSLQRIVSEINFNVFIFEIYHLAFNSMFYYILRK